MKILNRICEVVELETGIDIKTANTRKRRVVDARKIYASISRSVTKLPYESIGEVINKDHATIMFYVKSTNGLLLTDRDFRHTHECCLNHFTEYDTKESFIDAYNYHTKRAEYYLKKISE